MSTGAERRGLTPDEHHRERAQRKKELIDRRIAQMQDEGVEPERMIRVEWASSGSEAYDADIQVISYDKAGLLADLSSLFATLEVPIVAISARTMKNGTTQITLTLSIKNTAQLEKIIKQLRKRNDIIEVFRVST